MLGTIVRRNVWCLRGASVGQDFRCFASLSMTVKGGVWQLLTALVRQTFSCFAVAQRDRKAALSDGGDRSRGVASTLPHLCHSERSEESKLAPNKSAAESLRPRPTLVILSTAKNLNSRPTKAPWDRRLLGMIARQDMFVAAWRFGRPGF